MNGSFPASQPKKVKLEIPCCPQFISVARKTVESLCSCLSFTKQDIGDITLAVGEACTNAVKFSSDEKAPIHITCAVVQGKLEITVRNRGKAFGKNRQYPVLPPKEKLDGGGMGLFLISKVMDELSVTSRSGVTTLRMAKKLGSMT